MNTQRKFILSRPRGRSPNAALRFLMKKNLFRKIMPISTMLFTVTLAKATSPDAYNYLYTNFSGSLPQFSADAQDETRMALCIWE